MGDSKLRILEFLLLYKDPHTGDCTPAVLIDILSAPAFNSRRTSSTWRTPPPTVSGMKT